MGPWVAACASSAAMSVLDRLVRAALALRGVDGSAEVVQQCVGSLLGLQVVELGLALGHAGLRLLGHLLGLDLELVHESHRVVPSSCRV